MLDGMNQVVNFLSANRGNAGDEDGCVQFLQESVRGVAFVLNNKDHAKMGIVLIQDRRGVVAKPGIDALAGANHQYARTPVRLRAVRANVTRRANTVEEAEDAEEDGER